MKNSHRAANPAETHAFRAQVLNGILSALYGIKDDAGHDAATLVVREYAEIIWPNGIDDPGWKTTRLARTLGKDWELEIKDLKLVITTKRTEKTKTYSTEIEDFKQHIRKRIAEENAITGYMSSGTDDFSGCLKNTGLWNEKKKTIDLGHVEIPEPPKSWVEFIENPELELIKQKLRKIKISPIYDIWPLCDDKVVDYLDMNRFETENGQGLAFKLNIPFRTAPAAMEYDVQVKNGGDTVSAQDITEYGQTSSELVDEIELYLCRVFKGMFKENKNEELDVDSTHVVSVPQTEIFTFKNSGKAPVYFAVSDKHKRRKTLCVNPDAERTCEGWEFKGPFATDSEACEAVMDTERVLDINDLRRDFMFGRCELRELWEKRILGIMRKMDEDNPYISEIYGKEPPFSFSDIRMVDVEVSEDFTVFKFHVKESDNDLEEMNCDVMATIFKVNSSPNIKTYDEDKLPKSLFYHAMRELFFLEKIPVDEPGPTN